MKKIVVVNGSCRQLGNTQKLIDAFLEELLPLIEPHSVTTIAPGSFDLRPSNSPEDSFLTGADQLEREQIDDSAVIKQILIQSDLVVFASPTYYANVSAFMKLFIDRFCHLTHLFYFAGKPAILAATSDGRGHTQVLSYLQTFATGLGMPILGKIVSCGKPSSERAHIRVAALAAAKRMNSKGRSAETSVDLEASFTLWKRIIISRQGHSYEDEYWRNSGLIDCDSLREYIELVSNKQGRCRV